MSTAWMKWNASLALTFFPALPDDVEKKVEAMQDLNLWSFR